MSIFVQSKHIEPLLNVLWELRPYFRFQYWSSSVQ